MIEAVLPPVIGRLRALAGYRTLWGERSRLGLGLTFAYAFRAPGLWRAGGGRTERVVRAHLFVAGGRTFTVVAEAAREGWEDGVLLTATRLIELDMARDSREEGAADIRPNASSFTRGERPWKAAPNGDSDR